MRKDVLIAPCAFATPDSWLFFKWSCPGQRGNSDLSLPGRGFRVSYGW